MFYSNIFYIKTSSLFSFNKRQLLLLSITILILPNKKNVIANNVQRFELFLKAKMYKYIFNLQV